MCRYPASIAASTAAPTSPGGHSQVPSPIAGMLCPSLPNIMSGAFNVVPSTAISLIFFLLLIILLGFFCCFTLIFSIFSLFMDPVHSFLLRFPKLIEQCWTSGFFSVGTRARLHRNAVVDSPWVLVGLGD